MNVAILFGGPSVEHDISIITAMQINSAINKKKYDVTLIYYSKDKKFYQVQNFDYFVKNSQDIKVLEEITLNRLGVKKRGKFSKTKPIDFILCAFHGKNTESGELAGYFETIGIPYSSNSVLGASIGQDKIIMKKILKYDGISVLPFISIDCKGYIKWDSELLEKINELGYPLIVKPSNLGSSIGIQKINNFEELKKAVDKAFTFDNSVIIEPCLEDFREFNCAILENVVSGVEEIVIKHDIFSFEDKYQTPENTHILPALIDNDLENEIIALTMETSKSLKNESIARIDFLYDNKEKKLYVNEINTIPGALSYYLFEDKGIYFDELIDKIINVGLKRDYKNKNLRNTFISSVLNQSNNNKMHK